MPAKSFKDLIVWQKAFSLAEEVYMLCKQLPDNEKFALANQLQRSAVSIVSNIAEGYERNNRKEYVHFLSLARGSSAELEAQLLLAEKVYKIKINFAMSLLTEVQKLLWTINQRLKGRKPMP